MANLELINVSIDSYPLFEYCVKNGFFEGDLDEWYSDSNELAFFEGDPDMLKIEGETGYFCRCGDKVFYYIDEDLDEKARGILRDFFKDSEYKHYGYYHYYSPSKRMQSMSWDQYEHIDNIIAYRGGCGYLYNFLPLAA